MIKIPAYDPKPEYVLLKDEIDAAIQGVLDSGRFIMGPEVTRFEENVAAYLGVKHTVGLNSGTDAIVIGLQALGVGAGDEVITTAFSFFATAEAISHLDAVPIFVDIDPVTFNIDVSKIEDKITERTKAIIPVHLYGHAADMDVITDLAQRYGLWILEDVAQAFGGKWKGKKLGAIGEIGALSFFPTKNLGAYGDGGMLVTENDDYARMAKMLRTHGAQKKYYNQIVGYNTRLDALQAAILNVKLNYLDHSNTLRRKAAERYSQMLAGVDGVTIPREASGAYHVYHQFTLRIRDGKRDQVQAKLAERGIGSMVYYPVPMHRLPVYQDLGWQIPQAELAAAEVLSVPLWPLIDEETQREVVSALEEAVR
ncbi:MAG: DegT/DnrJ/EryC1/StrS family aminotransferase [Anaerolineales bacterium]|nr:DegT/DnrJ/EryC1/StrS family aminotransferase [Anaerolineales bacterium]